jgi:hypothetical protein
MRYTGGILLVHENGPAHTELCQMKHCSFRLEPSPKSEIGKGLKGLHTIYTLQIEDDIRRSSSTLAASPRPQALEQLLRLPPTC